MAFNKEAFEKELQEQYDSLDKKGFAQLMTASENKIKELLESGDIKFQKNVETDEYEISFVSNPYYEPAVKSWQFARMTKRLSFKQYKCLCAFTKFKPQSAQTQFKQF